MLRIGINGFGRIGRAVARILSEQPDLKLVVVNELDADLENFVYLLKYDSLYGRFNRPVQADPERRMMRIGDDCVAFYSESTITRVAWATHQVDVVIEASGVDANVVGAHDVIGHGAAKVVVTNAHCAVGATIIIGVNEHTYDPAVHHVVSSSICDANAIAPLLYHLDRQWGIEAGYVTTLHPWLSYQNLLDGPVSSIAAPGHSWRDYGLGRASVLNLIPKDTTAARATLAVLPALEGRLEAISFRVPTHVVSASDLSITLKTETTVDAVNDYFAGLAKQQPRVMGFERDHLVSSDFMATTQSCVVDGRRTRLIRGRLLKMVTWYDNEWGYSNRVVDVTRLVAGVFH